MKKQIAAALIATGLVMGSAFASSEQMYVPGEVIVKYKSGMLRTNSMMNNFYDRVGVKSVQFFSGMLYDFEKLTLSNQSVSEALKRLEQNSMVEYAQPNYVYQAFPTTDKKITENPPLEVVAGTPCLIPGLPFPPGCEDSGGGGGGGGETPCIIPGIPFPPGCTDSGGGPGNPGNPPKKRPELAEPPADVNPPKADPDLAKAWGIEKVGAPEVWKTHRGDKEFVVAGIDTGIDYNHEDLSFNMWRNPDPSEGDVVGFDFIHNDGLPYDDQGHGTHTAGTVGATGGNGIGVSGVTQRVSIMALKFLSAGGQGTTEGAIRAIDYATTHGARVMNNSWGGKGAGLGDKALSDAVTRSQEAGVLFVAAAGNDGANNDRPNEASFPAAFDHENILAVAATDENDKMAFFSNYGAKSTDVAAPGVNTYSTLPGNQYKGFSGTSMASPHVAGAAALVWSRFPQLTYKDIKSVLMKTVDEAPSLKGKTVTGGRINVKKAMELAEKL